MTHDFNGIEYQVSFTDLSKLNGYSRRNFILKDKKEKQITFTVGYKMVNDLPKCIFEEPISIGFPKAKQAAILTQSLGL